MRNLIFILAIGVNFCLGQNFTDPMGIPASDHFIPNVKASVDVSDIPVMSTTITKTFASPTALPTGIASDSIFLYVIGYNEYNVYKLSAEDGTLIESIPIDIQRPYGISVRDGLIYLLDNQNKMLQVIDDSGNVISNSPIRSDAYVGYPAGLFVCTCSVWFNDTQAPSPVAENDSTICLAKEDCTFNQGFASFGDFPTGIAMNESYMWVTDNVSRNTFRLSTDNFEVIDRIEAPGGAYPNGLALEKNGLWYINNDSDSIYYVEMPVTTNIEKPKENNFVNVFPNPSTDYFEISWTDEFSFPNVTISDASGKTVMSTAVNKNEKIDIQSLEKGIYFVVISEKDRKSIGKRIIVI